MAPIHVGTSGWVYPHWKGTFYPVELPQHARLAYYAQFLRTVEVNNTYYRLPSQHALQVWRDTVPDEFVFVFKAHRYITHRKKLVGVEDSLDLFFESLEPIADRVGAVLFQLPPFLGFDPERLDAFLGLLPEGRRYVMEFRHPGWHNEQTYEILRLHDVGFTIHDFGMDPEMVATSQDVYVRLHGPVAPYQGKYDAATLSRWARHARAWSREGRTVWFYFNNDQNAYAVENARELQDMLGLADAGGPAAGDRASA